MLKSFLMLPAALLFTPPMNATPTSEFEKGVVTLEPGNWDWEYSVDLAGFPIEEDNQECLKPEMSQMSIQDIMDEVLSKLPDLVRPSCDVNAITPQADGFDFEMRCVGLFTGDATGTFRQSSLENATLEATGMVGFDRSGDQSFSFSANANRQGVCKG